MASWIVHLRIAEDLLARTPWLDEEMFAVGNIAPDSGIPDEKWENFDPPPRVTHFQPEEEQRFRSLDMAYARAYLLPALRPLTDIKRGSFLLGYFCHLVTDNLWSAQIGKPTMERYAAEFAADRDFIWEVKKDWYGLDFVYAHTHPDCLFWRVFMISGYAQDWLDFLPAAAIQRNITYIQDYYSELDEDKRERMQRSFVYLSPAEMDAFTSGAAQTLERLIQRLEHEPVERLAGLDSALELLGEAA